MPSTTLQSKAASYLNYASRVSIPSYKSPKGTVGFPLPRHESFPENNTVTETENILVQNTVDALIQITDMNVAPSDTTSSVGDDGLTKEWPSNDKGCLFVFIAYYVAHQRAKVSKDMLCRILEYLTLDNRFLANVYSHKFNSEK